MICPNCKNQMMDESTICPYCQANLQPIQNQPERVQPTNNIPTQNIQPMSPPQEPINQQPLNSQPTFQQPANIPPQINQGATNYDSDNNSVEKKKNNNILLILIILIVVGVSAFLIFNSISNNKSSNNGGSNNSSGQQNNDIIDNNNDSDDDTIIPGKLVIATVGHVAHGKTELTSAITKYFGKYVEYNKLDRGQEYNENGIMIQAATVTYKTENREYLQYDFVGNADVIKSLISGFAKIDGAILVVSAADEAMYQAREHLSLLKEIGIPRVVVYMNDCDKVNDSELLDLVEMIIRESLDDTGFNVDKTPIIRGSANKAIEGDESAVQSIKDLMASVDKWIKPLKDNESSLSFHKEFDAEIYRLSKEEGGTTEIIKDNHSITLNFDSNSVTGTITIPSLGVLMPGDNCKVKITLSNKQKMKKGEHFQIKEDGKLMGIGVVVQTID